MANGHRVDNVKLDGEEVLEAEDFTATAGGFGAGMQYYIDRTWFLAGTLYITEVTFERTYCSTLKKSTP